MFGFCLGQEVGADQIIIHTGTGQNSRRFLGGHIVAAPLTLRVEIEGQVGPGHAVRQQAAQPCAVRHQGAEAGGLGVVAVRAKVGRTVRIGEGGAVEGVGNQAVHPADQHIVNQPFFQPRPLVPAVSTKQLTHTAAFLFGIQVGKAAAKFAEQEGKEFVFTRG